MGAEGEREGGPEPLAGGLAEPAAEWPEGFVDVPHPAVGSHGCAVAVGLVGEPGVHVDAPAGADQGLVGQHRVGEGGGQGREPFRGIVGREAGDEERPGTL